MYWSVVVLLFVGRGPSDLLRSSVVVFMVISAVASSGAICREFVMRGKSDDEAVKMTTVITITAAPAVAAIANQRGGLQRKSLGTILLIIYEPFMVKYRQMKQLLRHAKKAAHGTAVNVLRGWRSTKLGRLVANATTRQRWIAGSFALVFILSLGITFFVSQKKAYAWWNTGWLNRKTITVNTSGLSTLTNFPLRVSLDGTKITYGNTKAGGADIRFVDSDDTTALNYQIETWNSSGTSELWVSIPSLTGGGSYTFYMYYNNASATDAQSATSVFSTSNSYTAVYHMAESGNGTSGEFKDATANANNGQGGAGSLSATPTRVAGQMGYGQSFDNVNDYITAPRTASLNLTGNMTMSAWIKRSATTDYGAIFGKDQGQAADYELFICHTFGGCASPNSNKFGFYFDGVTNGGPLSSTQITDTTTWHQIVGVKNGTTYSVYLDGNLDNSGTFSGSVTNNNYPLQIGVDDVNTSTSFFAGSMDEIRLLSTARSANEIKADYLTGTNTINTFGTEESLGPDVPTLTNVSSPSTLNPVFQLKATDSSGAGYARYKIDVCSTSDCSSIVRTIDQTSSQTGWSGQNQQTSTAYTIGTTLGASTLATYTYQAPALSPGTQYWWRGYVINPGTNNAFTAASSISTFTTSAVPAAPTLSSPADAATISSGNGPTFQFRGSDADGDYGRYKIEVCSTSNCSSVVRTIDQTSSQTGWSGQDQQTSTAYTLATSAASSTMATHVYQAPALTNGTTYYWRAYTIDPGGSNTWSSASSIRSFVYQNNVAPAAPTLISPSSAQTGVNISPLFQLRTTDANNDYLRYKIDVCTTSNCSSILQTIDQSVSQTGWSGQDVQSGTAYAGSSTLTSSTIANYVWQPTALSNNTTYWWRAYAIDPGGINTSSSASSIQSFTTAASGTSQKGITGGTKITGGTRIGN